MSLHIESPYLASQGLWLRGNLHVHTTCSDGRSDPQEVVRHYANLGYDFLAISDHDVLADLSDLDDCGMTLIAANEICGSSPHMLHVAGGSRVAADEDLQKVLDGIERDAGFAVLCHPNWLEQYDHYSFDMLLSLSGYVGIEIFNGLVLDQPGSHLAIDKWDRLLTAGRRVWGFANDDAHRLDQAGRGWNVVRAKDRSPGAIIEALRTGSFYASSGVSIERIESDGAQLTVVAPDAARIWVFGHNGKRLAAAEGPELRLDAAEIDSPFVRVEGLGQAGAVAWTQPFFLRGGLSDQVRERFEAVDSTLVALRSERAPQLRGDLSDPLWQQAPASNGFLTMRDGTRPDVATEVRCVLAEGSLFFGLRCEEPQPITPAPDSGSLWAQDCVEIFIDPSRRSAGHLQVIATADGRCSVQAHGRVPGGVPKAEARAAREPTGYTLEVAVPVSVLTEPVDEGTCWRVHFSRRRKAAGEDLAWSFVGTSNHNRTRYGRLML